ncbi:MAG: heparan-alpha-glucosaminide N-acetyltransferase domain-containing protein [Polyangiales bacterium]
MNLSPSPAPRRVFLDVLRLIAAVQMIQGHTIDALLAPVHRTGGVFAVWSFARGLTSVMFLLTAGLAFVLAEARGDEVRARRRRRRALMLIAIGYVMHAPLGVLVGVPREVALANALVVDVLQCIGVSLLALELLSLRVKREGARASAALALAVLCFAAAPLSNLPVLASGPRALGNYVTTAWGSPFPLVPWAGYVLAGFGLGQLALGGARDRAWVLGAASLACGLSSLVAEWIAPGLPAAVSPSYCLLKLACVLALATALMRALAGARRLPVRLAQLAGETLFLYVAHVVILYADGVGLAHRLGRAHSPWLAIGIALVLLVGCAAAALAAPWARRSLRRAARGGTRGATP